MSVEDGGPAYPIGSGDMRDPTKLSIRDWFAGMAMQGLISNKAHENPMHLELVAIQAFEIANEMIERRENE